MRIKSLSEILSTLIDRTLINTHELNDFSVGSVTLSLYESIAMELEMYSVLQKQNIEWGIEHGVYEAFGFERREARRAYGELIVEFHTAVKDRTVIPRGTTFFSSMSGYPQIYETLKDYYVPSGESRAVINVHCTTPGTVGNVPKNVINTNSNSVFNIKSIRNPYAILTGQDREPLENVKQRFRAFIETRGRATDRAIAYGVRQVEDVSGVYVDGQVGRILVYVHDLNGNLPEELKRRVTRAVQDYRPSGVRLDVVPIEKREVSLNVEVTLRDKTAKTEAFRQEIEENLIHYLNTMEVSDDLILSSVVQRIKNIDDYQIYDVEITGLDKNLIVDNNQLIRAGDVAVTLL